MSRDSVKAVGNPLRLKLPYTNPHSSYLLNLEKLLSFVVKTRKAQSVDKMASRKVSSLRFQLPFLGRKEDRRQKSQRLSKTFPSFLQTRILFLLSFLFLLQHLALLFMEMYAKYFAYFILFTNFQNASRFVEIMRNLHDNFRVQSALHYRCAKVVNDVSRNSALVGLLVQTASAFLLQ